MPGWRPITWIGIGVLLGAGAEAQSFGERTDVVLVEVPVVVSNARGESVRGLGREDFVLLDDGRPQQLAGFQVVDLHGTRTQSPEPAIAEIPAAARRHLLLVFDLVFSSPAATLRAQEAARRFVLEALAPSDLAAVASFTLEDGARVLAGFTTDRAQLARAIDALGLVTAPTPSTPPDAREGSDSEQRRISVWARGLGEMGERLAGLPARQQVIYFSEGFEGRRLFGRRGGADDPEQRRERHALERGEIWRSSSDERSGSSELRAEVDRMLETFRRAGCTLHTVDLAASAEDRPERDVLHQLATATGGALILGGDLAAALARNLERSALTYLLSFYPSKMGQPGEQHRLEVRLRNAPRGTQIVHRQVYSLPGATAELHPFEQALLTAQPITDRPRNDLDPAVLAVPFATGGSHAYVAVIVELGGEALLSKASGTTLPIELYAYALDVKGRLRASFRERLDLDLAKAGEQLGEGLSYYGHLDLEPGDYQLKVLATQTAGNRTGLTTVMLHVPRPEEPWLSPPLFPATGQPLRLREKTAPSEHGTVIYPFLDGKKPFIPSARPEIRSGERVAFFLFGQNLPAGDPQASLERGEEKQALELTLIERRSGNLETLVLSLAGQGLGEGEGILKVRLSGLESAVTVTPTWP